MPKTSIKPTVGRMVWCKIPEYSKYLPATIVHVCQDDDDHVVDLVVFGRRVGWIVKSYESVPMHDCPSGGGLLDAPPNAMYAVWMPYQMGQAAKTQEVMAGAVNPEPVSRVTKPESHGYQRPPGYVANTEKPDPPVDEDDN